MIVRIIVPVLVVLVAGCTTVPGSTTAEPVTDHVSMATGDLWLPPLAAAPLVVMVPGGAWRTADPAGFTDLAVALGAAGLAVMTTTVRAADDGVVYPTPVEDVLCAVAAAAATATDEGVTPGPVVVLGHSTGAQLAALAALAPDRYQPSCGDPVVVPDALIGMSGTYNVDLVASIAVDLFGVSRAEAPQAWQEGNAQLAAALRPDLPVLLIHGAADDLVPIAFTNGFAAALGDAGHLVTTQIVEGADHHSIYRPETVSDLVIRWIGGL